VCSAERFRPTACPPVEDDTQRQVKQMQISLGVTIGGS
jgi:hypothetical protein